MGIPDRGSIKSDLVTLIRDRGTVSPAEAYVALAAKWHLTPDERTKVRGSRRLYEHEIRWARQELVIDGLLQTTRVAGRSTWRLTEPLPGVTSITAGPLVEMVQGFLNPSHWFLESWFPQYASTVEVVQRSIAEGNIDTAVDVIWLQQDNSVSHPGQGVLPSRDVAANREFFRALTLEIARDPSPTVFDKVLEDVRKARKAGLLSKLPRLLVSRAFATLSPERYHTTVDAENHERVVTWFEHHTSFRATAGNWAHRAMELSDYLKGVAQLNGSPLIRNMFPWFVFTQIDDRDGRPLFTPGHRSRSRTGAGRDGRAVEAIVLRHNLLVESLYAELSAQYGRKAVGTEQPSGLGGFVDAIVRVTGERYWIYEVKVTDTASDAIRQALGQLLEYAYRQGAWNPQRMFVIAEPPLDGASRRYLARLRRQFKLPIAYRQLHLS